MEQMYSRRAGAARAPGSRPAAALSVVFRPHAVLDVESRANLSSETSWRTLAMVVSVVGCVLHRAAMQTPGSPPRLPALSGSAPGVRLAYFCQMSRHGDAVLGS